jgi:hypothetical protein
MAEKTTMYHTAIDHDGTLCDKPHKNNTWRRMFKTGLKPQPKVVEGILFLQSQPDVNVAGIYTARPRLLHKRQTRRQLDRWGIPIDRVVHTANSSRKKVKAVLLDIKDARKDGKDVRGILIDDSEEKIVKATKRIIERDPVLGPLAEKAFTIVIFDSKRPDRTQQPVKRTSPHVVHLPSWAKQDTNRMLDEIRKRA